MRQTSATRASGTASVVDCWACRRRCSRMRTWMTHPRTDYCRTPVAESGRPATESDPWLFWTWSAAERPADWAEERPSFRRPKQWTCTDHRTRLRDPHRATCQPRPGRCLATAADGCDEIWDLRFHSASRCPTGRLRRTIPRPFRTTCDFRWRSTVLLLPLRPNVLHCPNQTRAALQSTAAGTRRTRRSCKSRRTDWARNGTRPATDYQTDCAHNSNGCRHRRNRQTQDRPPALDCVPLPPDQVQGTS